MAFKLGKETRHDGTHSARMPETPLTFGTAANPGIIAQLGTNPTPPGIKTGGDLESGTLAQANNDGSTDIDPSVDPNSSLFKRIEAHEGQHQDDMKSGKAGYTDHTVTWEGNTHDRVNVNGEWGVMWEGAFRKDGWKGFPWEQSAIQAEKKV